MPDPRLLNDGELFTILRMLPEANQKLVSHVLARLDANDDRIRNLEEIVYVVRKSYGLLKWVLPFVLPLAGFILRGLL